MERQIAAYKSEPRRRGASSHRALPTMGCGSGQLLSRRRRPSEETEREQH